MKGENKQQRYYRTQKEKTGRSKVCVMATEQEAEKIIDFAKALRKGTEVKKLNRDAMLKYLSAYSVWRVGSGLPEGWMWLHGVVTNGGILDITEDNWIAERLKTN